MTSSRTTLASFLTLGLLAVVGAFLLLKATPEGLNLSDDSIAYIAGARSLLAGQGYREAWLESNQPVSHFPPGFSGTLALLGLSGLDPLRGARFLNAILFGLNAALLGWLGWRMTKSSVGGIVLAALFLVDASLLRVHAAAMSEPLFLFFSLLAFLHFDFYFSTSSSGNAPSDGWLVAAGVLTSLAYLTRYSGLALVATFLVALFVLQDGWKKRFISAGIFLVSFAPLVAAWSIRNRLVAGNATNRVLVWHPVTLDTLMQGLRTFSEFLIPVEEWRRELYKTPGIFVAVIALIALALLAWMLPVALRRLFNPQVPRPDVIGFTNGLYIFGYMGAVLFSISFFDASTPLKVRILAPVYLPLLLLTVAVGVWLWNRFGRSAGAVRVAVGAAALIVFSVAALGQVRTVQELSKGGQGFASFKWYDSKAMEVIRQLPASTFIYTNEPGAVYLYTGRRCRVLPDLVDPVTGLPRGGYEKGVATLQADVRAARAVLVLFDNGPEFKPLTDGLNVWQKFGNDVVYFPPPPQ